MCLAVPGLVESIRDEAGVPMGRLNFGGVRKDVCLAYVPGITVGDYAIVHVGFAIGRLDEVAARAALRTFAELGLLEDGRAELRATNQPTGGSSPA